MNRANTLLLTGALAIVALPLFLPAGTTGPGAPAEPFAGADTQAAAAIAAANPDYRPWFAPLWEPPGGEMESLLFALQATLGAGLLGYYLGLRRGQSQPRRTEEGSAAHERKCKDGMTRRGEFSRE